MRPRLTFVNYRVSSEEQNHGFSQEAQERSIEAYCKANGLQIVQPVFRFRESASKWEKRTKFIGMLDRAEREGIKDIVFEKVDRAVREFNAAIKIEALIQMGVRFHFVRDSLIIDEQSPSSDKLRFYLQIILSKYYIDNLRDEIQKGRHERIDNGLYPGKAPIGYLNLRESKRKSIIIVDQPAKPYIKSVFELFVTGNHSYDSIHEILKVRFPDLFKSHPTGTSRRNVEKILANHFYYGFFQLKGVLHKGVHDPIITKRLFDEAQSILRQRAGKYKNQKRGKLEFLGFARCSNCDAAFTGEVKRTRHGNIYHYYRCSNPKCPFQKKVISEAKFVALWTEPLRNLSYTPDLVKTFRDILLEHHQSELAAYQQNMRDLNQRHAEITTKIHAAYDDKLRKQIPADVFNNMYSLWQTEREQIEEQLRSHNVADKEYIEFGSNLIETVANASSYYEISENVAQKRKLLEIILSNPKTDGLTIQYDYKKPFDLLSKIELKSEWWR